jgi:site-specific DNA-methyltransferase (adenine-specific)
MLVEEKRRAERNRTLSLTGKDRARLAAMLIRNLPPSRLSQPVTGTIHGDYRRWVDSLPLAHIDLLFLDPPYNLNKSFNGRQFAKRSTYQYTAWLDDILRSLIPLLKQTATVYICGDWLTSHSIFEAASSHFFIRNRITWEREKGRGAQTNYKNVSEDIWFCSVGETYTFNLDAVKLRRRVIAPYTDANGNPKDWHRSGSGNFRDTHPSNLWTDITIPFWSMPENTDHPTQKSEKLLAKLLLASTHPGDFVFDPFLGSGTTSVVAKKLGRRYLGIECDLEYCYLAARRLELANTNKDIQGFADGVFWERNSLSVQKKAMNQSRNGDIFSNEHS